MVTHVPCVWGLLIMWGVYMCGGGSILDSLYLPVNFIEPRTALKRKKKRGTWWVEEKHVKHVMNLKMCAKNATFENIILGLCPT